MWFWHQTRRHPHRLFVYLNDTRILCDKYGNIIWMSNGNPERAERVWKVCCDKALLRVDAPNSLTRSRCCCVYMWPGVVRVTAAMAHELEQSGTWCPGAHASTRLHLYYDLSRKRHMELFSFCMMLSRDSWSTTNPASPKSMQRQRTRARKQ